MNNRDRSQSNIPPCRTAAQAFTLIEILIVIALTAVLFALLLVPLVSALRYTQQAQLVTAAQDAARSTEERISRELSSAVFVFDGTSHPFQTASPIAAGDDRYTNFLDLQILSSTGTSVVAHAYNAKIDFVLPKANAGTVTDPTTQQSINYVASQNGSAIVSNPSLVFPLAAGANMIRYFIGLKNPAQQFGNPAVYSYNNTREGKSIGSDDNTYVLYRAEFQPYQITSPTQPNTNLFATRTNGSGVSIPELDDPDFFRYVTGSDVDWLDDQHRSYNTVDSTGQLVKDHNMRVDKWFQISKPVIPGPDVDLILLPHNADNTLAYDAGTPITANPGTCTATSCPAVAHSGIAHDPVGGGYYPIVNTSCTFRPATISGNATPGTTADYNSQGVAAADQSGFTYIPTVYTATSQSWSLPYHVSVYPGNYDPANSALNMYYDTEQFAAGQTPVMPPAPSGASAISVNPGDILEYLHASTDTTAQGKLVYNVTQGYPVTVSTGGGMGTAYTLGGTNFVPMTINPDTGTITFSAPYLPNGPYDRLTRQKMYDVLAPGASANTIDTTPGITADGTVDLTLPATFPAALTDSPLQGVHTLTQAGGPAVTGDLNAHIVPGSVRVTGPDQTPGPNNGQPITYTEIKSSLAGEVGDNQFYVDYGISVLHLKTGATGPIGVIYDYQANMSLTTPLPTPLPSTFVPPILTLDPDYTPYLPYLPMQVTVDYQTRDLIDVSIGVRIYDVTNNRAQVIPAETKIKIGNSNR